MNRPLLYYICLAFLITMTGWVSFANAQGTAVNLPTAQQSVFENNHIKVTHPVYQPGDSVGMHEHSAGLVITLTDLNISNKLPDGTSRTLHDTAGRVFWRNATRHSLKNVGEKTLELVEIEFKDTIAPATKPLRISTIHEIHDPLTADSLHFNLAFENNLTRVLRFRLPPHEKTPMLDFADRVGVNFPDVHVRITMPDGKQEERTVKAHGVNWRPAGRMSFENLSDEALEILFIEPFIH